MFFEEAGNMSDIRPATIVFKFDGDSLLAGSGQRRSQPAKPAKASKATTNLTKCSVRECGVIQQPPSRIVMHSSLQHSDLTVAAWRNFFQMNKFTKFPKRVFICQYHFTEDCHTPKGQLRLNSIPTIRIPLALQAAEGPDEPPSPQSIPSHPVRDAPKGPSPSSPFPRKSSTDQWTGFHDLLNALAPYALKTPSSKWVILNFPHAKPANISFECLEENVSYKSVTFSGSLDATIMIRGNRYTKEETRVCQASELETLLATIDALEVLPCGCVPWGHVSDFEYDLPKVILPSEDWFTFSLIKRQYQILFQRVDDHGRSIKCLSFSLSLLPRLHVRNKRCLENDKDLQEPVKCTHDVEKLLEQVDKLRVCSQTNYLPPAKAETFRRSCQLVVLPSYNGKRWERTICPACHSAEYCRRRKEQRELKRKAVKALEREELAGLRKQLKKLEQNNDKLLSVSTDAVEQLLNQMKDVNPVMDPDSEEKEEEEVVLTV